MTIINGWQSPASYFVAHNNSMSNARCHMFHIHKPLRMHSLLKPAASVNPSELQIAEYWQHSHHLLLLLLLLCSSALVALILLLLPIVVDQISSSFFPLLLFFFFFFLARFAKWNSTDCFTNNVWQQMNYFWIQKQKIKKDLEIWQENRRSPEEGKTERKRTGEHGPLDATRTTEDKTRRRVRTDGHDKNTRRRNPDQYTDRGIKL